MFVIIFVFAMWFLAFLIDCYFIQYKEGFVYTVKKRTQDNWSEVTLEWGLRKPTRVEKIIQECGCVCYCPRCRNPLNDTSEMEAVDERGVYEYTCADCGEKSRFNFFVYGLPVLEEELYRKPSD